MKPSTILLVDDEPNTLKVLSAILKKKGFDVITTLSAELALEKISEIDVDLVITDFKLPGISGMELVDIILEKRQNLPIIMLTAFGTIEKAVEAMKKGAFNYLTKPVNYDELLIVVNEALEMQKIKRENIILKSQLKEKYSFQKIIGKSQKMQDLFNLIMTISKSNSNVLITGESGTGKELVAKAIHYESSRADKPFVPIDCTSIPAEIFESELFGHERGSFTGAYEKKIGQIEIANEGTVFLDEISELPFMLQKKFLRFLQEKEILRVGGSKRIKVDVRIIAATNKDLIEEIHKGNFREDLYYRLNVVSLRTPPLRERKDDIPLLSDFFLRKFNQSNKKEIRGFEPEAKEALLDYGWRGNVRELENAIERAVVLCNSDTISLRHLPRSIGEINKQEQRLDYGITLLEKEKMLIIEALEKTSYNQTKSAELLGISRKQLRTKMKNHGLLSSKEAED